MHKTTKKLFLVPALVAALALTGCTSSGSVESAGAGAAGAGSRSHLTEILKSKKIRIAVQTEAAPWGVMQASGDYEGFDIDLANALGKSVGAEVEFVSTTNESRIPLLQTDKADVVIASLTATDVRAQSIEMTEPYAAGGTLIALPKDSPVTSYKDLAGKSVATSRGSIGEALLKSRFPEAKIVLFESFADSVQALKSQKVDALIENNVIVPELVDSDPNYRILDGPVLEPSLMSMGVKQGDQQWLNYLNNFIRNYNVSGANDEASRKWLHTSMPGFLK